MLDFHDPAVLWYLSVLATLTIGETQAVRGIPSVDGWMLPFVAGAWGVIDAVISVASPGNQLSGLPVSAGILAGLIVGFGGAGIVTVAVHWGNGTTQSPPPTP